MMLVPFEINPNSTIPRHVTEWVRYQILKKIDDTRYSMMRILNVDFTSDALRMLKIIFLLERANLRWDASGKLLDYDPIADAFDVTAMEIKQEAEAFIADVRNIPENFFSFATKTFNPSRVHGSSYDMTHMIGNAGFNNVLQSWTLPVLNTDIWLHEADVNTVVAGGPVSYVSVAKNSLFFIFYDWYRTQLNTKLNSTTHYAKSFNSTTKKTSWRNLVIQLSPRVLMVNLYYYAIEQMTGKVILPATTGVVGNLKATIGSGHDLRGQQEAMGLPLSTFINTSSLVNVNVPYRRSTINHPYLGSISQAIIDGAALSSQWNGTQFSMNNLYISNCDRLNTFAGDSKDTPMSEGLFFSSAVNASFFDLSTGNYRIRNGYLYGDGSKNFDLTFIYFMPDTMKKIEELVEVQLMLKDLLTDIKEGRFTEVTSSFVFNGVTYSNVRTSVFTQNGITEAVRHPQAGFPMNVNYYKTELYIKSLKLYAIVEAMIDRDLNQYKILNDQALTAAQQKFLQGKAQMAGPEAVAEYERKLRTGIFYFENGLEYWRAFTAEEQKVYDYLQQQALLNKQIAEQNEITLQRNLEAQLAVDAAVAQENAEKLSIAETMAKEEFRAKYTQLSLSLIVPTLQELAAVGRANGKRAVEMLEQWTLDNPHYVLNPVLVDDVEKKRDHLMQLEEKVATTMIVDQINEMEFTRALTELFKF